MSDTVDRRIVEMRFDNEQFEKNVSQTLITLDTLKKALEMNNAGKGFEEVQKSANRVDLSNVQNGVEQTTKQFSAMEIVAITALANITNSAVNAGKRLVSSFINPLISGGKQRALNMEQAKFMFGGLTNMQTGLKYTAKEIGSVGESGTIMDNLYNAVEGTFYSLDKAALIGSQLMAAGISGTSEDITKVLKGVAGVASMFGADYQRVGDIFVKVKTQGKLMGQDLMSLNTMGVPTIATITEYLNKMGDGAKYTQEQVSAMVSKGQIDFKIFSGAMQEAFGEQAAKSKQLFTGAVEDMAAAMARIGEKFWRPLIGSGGLGVNFFNAMVPVIDNINTVLTPAFNAWGNAAASLTKRLMPLIDLFGALFDYDNTLAELKKLSSENLKDVNGNYIVDPERVKLLEKNGRIIQALNAVLRDDAPAKYIDEIAQFYKVSPQILHFANNLQESFKKIHKTFSEGKEVLSAFATVFKEVFSGGDSGGIRQLAYGLGLTNSELEHIYDIVGGVKSVFNVLKNVITTIANIFLKVLNKVGIGLSENTGVFRGFFDLILSIFAAIGRLLSGVEKPLNSIINLISAVGSGLTNIFSGLGKVLGAISDRAIDVLDGLTLSLDGFGEKAVPVIEKLLSFSTGAIDAAFSALATAISKLGGALKIAGNVFLGFGVWNVLKAIGSWFKTLKESGLANVGIGEVFNQTRLMMIDVGTTFKIWQKSIQANTILKIAIAVGILAGSMKLLASIPAKRLLSATGAISAMFTELVAVTKMVNPVKISGLIGLAISVRILAGAVKAIGDMSGTDLAKGVIAVGALLGAMTMIVDHMFKLNTKMWHMKKTSVLPLVLAIIGLSLAVKLLVGPIKLLGSMDIASLAKGIVAVGILLGMLVGAMILLSNYLKLQSKGLLSFLGKQAQIYALVAVLLMLTGAVAILSLVVYKLGRMDITSLAKGLGSIAILLATIAGFVELVQLTAALPGEMLAMGAMMVAFAIAIKTMAEPIKMFANMKVTQLAKGLGSLAIILAEVFGFMMGMKLMGSGGKMFAVAGSLVVVAVGIKILASALKDLSSIANAAQGLAVLFGALLILGTAMVLLQGSIMGAAAIAAVSAAMWLLAPALLMLSTIDIEGIGNAILALVSVLGVLAVAAGLLVIFPELIPALLILAGVIVAVSAGLFLMGAAVGAVGAGIYLLGLGLQMLIDLFVNSAEAVKQVGLGLIELSADIGIAIAKGFISFMDVMIENKDTIIQYFSMLFDAIIDVLIDKIPRLVEAGLLMITSILTSIDDHIGEIADRSVSIVVNFCNAFFSEDNVARLTETGIEMVDNIINGIKQGIQNKIDDGTFASIGNTIIKLLIPLGGPIWALATGLGEDIGTNLAQGVDSAKPEVKDSSEGIQKTITDNTKPSDKDMIDIGSNSVSGIIKGMDNKKGDLKQKSKEIGTLVNDVIRMTNDIHSPSRVLMRTGEFMMLGLIAGLDNLTGDYQNRAKSISTMMIDSFDSSGGLDTLTPIINPIFGTADLSQLTSSVSLGLDAKMQEERALSNNISNLTKSLNAMTGTMNSRSLNVYNTIDGTADPEAFADGLIRSFRLNARTV